MVSTSVYRGNSMVIEKGFVYSLKMLELAVRVKAISEMYEKYKTIIDDERFDAAIKEAKKKAEQIIQDSDSDKATSTLEKADAKRDNIFRALGYLLKALNSLPIEKDNALSLPLFNTYNKYGASIVSLGYAEESGKIRSLLGDLSKAEFSENIASLYGVKETIEALKAAQDEFEAASKSFTEATASEKGKKSASEQKKELNTFFNDKIIRYVNFMIDMGDVKFVDFAKEINVEIQKANSQKQQPQAVSTNTPQNS